jgi:hypothetical protein
VADVASIAWPAQSSEAGVTGVIGSEYKGSIVRLRKTATFEVSQRTALRPTPRASGDQT